MEVELQYVYTGEGPLLVPVELAHLVLARSESFAIVDTYFDTEDLCLRRSGCSLRTRVADNQPSPRLTWKGPSRRSSDHNGKRRAETELPLDTLPETGRAMASILRKHGLWDVIRGAAGLGREAALQPVGQLRCRRSTHTYVHGLHRLELSWDRLAYPVGPAEIRLEVELRSAVAEDFLEQADRELRALFGAELLRPERGKVRELCERLYPALVAA